LSKFPGPRQSNIVWPVDTFNPPLQSGYKINPKTNVVTTEMARGTKSRQTSLQPPNNLLTCLFRWDDATYRIFEGWFHHYLADGALWFAMPVKTSNGVTPQAVRIRDKYKADPTDNGTWKVTFHLEQKNSVTMTKAAVEAALR